MLFLLGFVSLPHHCVHVTERWSGLGGLYAALVKRKGSELPPCTVLRTGIKLQAPSTSLQFVLGRLRFKDGATAVVGLLDDNDRVATQINHIHDKCHRGQASGQSGGANALRAA